MIDHYRTLGVARDATQGEIKTAYQKLVTGLHPDKHNDTDKEELLKDINKAYSVLKNSKKRKNYDKSLNTGIDETNIEGQARNWLLNELSNILETEDIIYESLIKQIKDEVQYSKRQLQEKEVTITKEIKRLTKNKAIILSKNNISEALIHVIESKIQLRDKTIIQIKENIQIGEKVLELLEDINILFTEEAHREFSTSSTSTIWTSNHFT